MKKLGCAPLAGIAIVLVVLLVFGGNEAAGIYMSECASEEDDDSMMDCLAEIFEDDEEEKPEGTVTATGVYSYKDYDVNITAHIPLGGGAVTGSVSGACDGKVTGSFDGNNNGVLSGKLTGSCDPFFIKIPAGADYTGSVNKTGRTVPFSFTGKGGGITHQGSTTLTWQAEEKPAE
jgi:hypothetical protein